MAEPYRERLATLLRVARLNRVRGLRLECKHFFSGAALYASGTICASLTPVGFAVKLPEGLRAALLRQHRGRPLRYFRGGPIKKEYVVLSDAILSQPTAVRGLLRESIRYATRHKAPKRP